MFEKLLTPERAINTNSPPSEEREAPTRRGFLLQVGALAAASLLPACDGRSLMHDTRFLPLAGIVENLRKLEVHGALDAESERNLSTLIERLEACKDDKCFGQVEDPQLSERVQDLLTDLAKLDRTDPEHVSKALKKAEDTLNLLCEDETHREMRIGMR